MPGVMLGTRRIQSRILPGGEIYPRINCENRIEIEECPKGRNQIRGAKAGMWGEGHEGTF